MKKGEFSVLIKHYFLREKSIKENEEKLGNYYKESAPSHGMVHRWFTEFRCGRISTSDAERPSRPKEVTSQEMINKIDEIVLNDRRLKVREISETVNILRRYVTVDKTWIHYYTPETKNQSKMWTGPDKSAPKKAKTVPSVSKDMATTFWDSHDIISIDYLQKGKHITGEHVQESIMPQY